MGTPFEDFVNAELPTKISTTIPPSGNLPPGQVLQTTGVGLGVVPTGGGGSGLTPYVQNIVVGPTIPSVFDLDFLPANFATTQAELQGVGMVYGVTRDFHVEASQNLFWHGAALDPGDVLVVLYYV